MYVSYQGDPGFVSHKVLNVSSSVFTKQKPIHVSSYTSRKNLDKFHAVIIGPCGFIVDFAIYVVQGQCECPLFSPWYSYESVAFYHLVFFRQKAKIFNMASSLYKTWLLTCFAMRANLAGLGFRSSVF